MANAIFTTKPEPWYDDLPELRSHFPHTYLRQAEQAIGDWIIYYEPRRQGDITLKATGRQSYFATARVTRIERDPDRDGYYYAYIADYLEFTSPVPFRERTSYFESGLQKADGTTNKGRFGRSVRVIPSDEYRLICRAGFSHELFGAEVAQARFILAEEPPAYGRSDRTVLLERPFRDAAFTRIVRGAYESICAFTGLKLINGGGHCEIEAAHIRPVEQDGPDSPRNGIALSRTVHWMFDRGIVSIGEEGNILMANALVPEPIRRMLNHNGQAHFPKQASLAPHPQFLRFHREVIFKGVDTC